MPQTKKRLSAFELNEIKLEITRKTPDGHGVIPFGIQKIQKMINEIEALKAQIEDFKKLVGVQ